MAGISELEAPYSNVVSGSAVSEANELFRITNPTDRPTSSVLLHLLKVEREQALAGLPATVSQIRALAGLREGWNGYDALPPDRRAVTHAIAWIRELYRDAVSNRRPWRQPHVTASADGEVVLEWWNGDKTLTVYLSPDEATYVKLWEGETETETDDGEAASSTRRQELWAWLES